MDVTCLWYTRTCVVITWEGVTLVGVTLEGVIWVDVKWLDVTWVDVIRECVTYIRVLPLRVNWEEVKR